MSTHPLVSTAVAIQTAAAAKKLASDKHKYNEILRRHDKPQNGDAEELARLFAEYPEGTDETKFLSDIRYRAEYPALQAVFDDVDNRRKHEIDCRRAIIAHDQESENIMIARNVARDALVTANITAKGRIDQSIDIQQVMGPMRVACSGLLIP